MEGGDPQFSASLIHLQPDRRRASQVEPISLEHFMKKDTRYQKVLKQAKAEALKRARQEVKRYG